jgi:hypothetical protein
MTEATDWISGHSTESDLCLDTVIMHSSQAAYKEESTSEGKSAKRRKCRL